MTAPSVVRRLRTRLDDARLRKLRSLLAAEQDRTRSLEERLAYLQKANEGHYRAQYDATGGPAFEKTPTVPAQPATPAAETLTTKEAR
ncbi:MAG TPA: hypothetical protein VFH77_08480 [Streptomyces sp.]|nr:hypothetical protein [Streptomyces sp.]